MASFLAFLLWWIGIHKFYLWRPWMGIVYLLFSWTMIPLFLGFIECLLFLFMPTHSFNDEYNLDYILKKEQLKNLKYNI
jgi:TM2 domain-containing membrane protein YozV